MLDPLGLNDYHIAHEASHSRGYGWLGHELGDGKYILDQKPDLILFASFEKTDSLFPADQQIVEDPRFKQYYQPVNFDTPEPNSVRAYTFVRRIDGKLGMESTGRSLMVRAFLAKIDAANSVHLVNGKATLTVPAEHDATFEQLPVGPGTWEIKLDSNQPAELSLSSVEGAERVPGCALCLETKVPGSVSFTLANQSAAPVDLQSLTLVPR